MTFPSDKTILAAAAKVETMSQLWKALPEVKDFQAVRAACKRLGITLPMIRPSRSGTPRPPQPVPKPTGGKGKAAAKGGGDG